MNKNKFSSIQLWLIPWTAGYLYTLGVWNQIAINQPMDVSFWSFVKGLCKIIGMFPLWPLLLAVFQNS